MRSRSIILYPRGISTAGWNRFLKHTNFEVNISFFQLSLLVCRVVSLVFCGRRVVEYQQTFRLQLCIHYRISSSLNSNKLPSQATSWLPFARLRFVRALACRWDSRCRTERETGPLVKVRKLTIGILSLDWVSLPSWHLW